MRTIPVHNIDALARSRLVTISVDAALMADEKFEASLLRDYVMGIGYQ